MLFWKEVYRGFSLEEFNRVKIILKTNRIPYKIKLHSAKDRLSNDVMLGVSPAAANPAGMASYNREYAVFVKKKDLEEAVFLCNRR